ncbi:NADAR family protein [Streptomyces sp. NPDC085612]|uniref:NADAR family protein n=1 Tax=Streptomyces sp. NPDC085612 TaxID=3365732 RepID=UPI0037D33C3F
MPCTTWHGPTFRISDGERIDGAWCLVWRRHDLLDEHFVEHLFVHADGLISCGGYDATGLAGLERMLATGRLALDPPHARERPEEHPEPPQRSKWMLLTDLGDAVDGDGPVATEEMHRHALDYLTDLTEAVARARRNRAVPYADDPPGLPVPPVAVDEAVYPGGRPAEPGLFTLRDAYDAPFTYEGRDYPTVSHAYWALSAADPADHDRIRAAATADRARELAGAAVRRADWSGVRLAVMAGLLRAKFDQHPRLADVLLATGDAPILHTGTSEAPFWRDGGTRGGRNWSGRLLELVRPELRCARSGQTPAARTAETALRAATRTGSQTGENGGA